MNGRRREIGGRFVRWELKEGGSFIDKPRVFCDGFVLCFCVAFCLCLVLLTCVCAFV